MASPSEEGQPGAALPQPQHWLTAAALLLLLTLVVPVMAGLT